MMTHAKTGLLFVDDEEKSHRYFRKTFSPKYEVWTASSVKEALSIFDAEKDRIAVVISDQRMPQATGIDLFREVQKLNPGTVRILTTAYSEVDVLVDAINKGSVFAFVTKPWQLEAFTETVERAVGFYEEQAKQKNLLDRKMRELRELVIQDQVLQNGNIAANLGHYIHNALFPVMLFLDQLLAESPSLSSSQNLVSAQKPFLLAMRDHIKSLNETLQYLRHESRQQSSAPIEIINARELLREAVANTREMRDSLQVDLTLSLPPEDLAWAGDADRLRALINLILAEEFSALSRGSHFEIRLKQGKLENELILEIEDDKPHHRGERGDSIFEPFNSRNDDPQDLGVFLAAAYIITRVLGGDVSTATSAQGGIFFRYRIPQADTLPPPDSLFGICH